MYRYRFSPVLSVSANRKLDGFKFGAFDLAQDKKFFTGNEDVILVSASLKQPEYFKDYFQSRDFKQQTYGFFAESEGSGALYIRSFPLGIKGYLQFTLENDPEVYYSKAYQLWVDSRLAKLPSVGVMLTDMAFIKGLKKNLVGIHGAAVTKEGIGVLIVGLPDTGKTLSTLRLVNQGFEFLSDDIVIMGDNSKLYSVPYTRTVESKMTLREKLRNKLFKYDNMRKGVIEVQDVKIAEETNLEYVFYIERGAKETKRTPLNSSVKRLLLSNRLEFSYYANPLLNMYSYYNESFALPSLMAEEERIIRSALEKTQSFLIRRKNPEEFFSTINEIVK